MPLHAQVPLLPLFDLFVVSCCFPDLGSIVAVEVAAGPDLPGGLLGGGGGGAAGHRLHAAGVPAHPLHTQKVRLQMLYTSPTPNSLLQGPSISTLELST